MLPFIAPATLIPAAAAEMPLRHFAAASCHDAAILRHYAIAFFIFLRYFRLFSFFILIAVSIFLFSPCYAFAAGCRYYELSYDDYCHFSAAAFSLRH
jgi:hypothetical protein